MSVAINFILNFIKNKVLEIIKSKYFLVFVLFSLMAFMVCFIIFQLKSKDIKIKELEETLYTTQLKLSNIVIQKNIAFQSNSQYIKDIYTNSSKYIEKLTEDKKYNSNEIMTLDKIIKDYNNARSLPR
ncbi:hypothetical protein [Brachyspira murdochii]|uniref:Uncharacterized protein n=1 Tax=Brachyspira murdochii TaxID=84378 RepID=A0ABX5B827_9SPIR|nr:hypothetical protein [Brachyspira murdochii]PPS22729.1 hypothetical protein DJ52_03215 [Brachyspira murdochii]